MSLPFPRSSTAAARQLCRSRPRHSLVLALPALFALCLQSTLQLTTSLGDRLIIAVWGTLVAEAAQIVAVAAAAALLDPEAPADDAAAVRFAWRRLRRASGGLAMWSLGSALLGMQWLTTMLGQLSLQTLGAGLPWANLGWMARLPRTAAPLALSHLSQPLWPSPDLQGMSLPDLLPRFSGTLQALLMVLFVLFLAAMAFALLLGWLLYRFYMVPCALGTRAPQLGEAMALSWRRMAGQIGPWSVLLIKLSCYRLGASAALFALGAILPFLHFSFSTAAALGELVYQPLHCWTQARFFATRTLGSANQPLSNTEWAP